MASVMWKNEANTGQLILNINNLDLAIKKIIWSSLYFPLFTK